MRATTIGMTVVLFLAAACATAAIPSTISYQGVLNDDTGTPVPDGDYDMTFSLYDVETGGTALWHEQQTVPVSGGIFNVQLGADSPLNSLQFDVPYCLGIEIGPEGEMSPRQWLTTSPYAFRAAVAESLDGGIPPDSDWVESGGNVYRATGNVGIGTSYPTVPLEVDGDTQFHGMLTCTSLNAWEDITAAGFALLSSPAAGYVLTCNDEFGFASWQPAATGVGGSGTADYVPKFTGSTTLADSPLRVSGDYVGINVNPAVHLHVNGKLQVEDEARFYGDLLSPNLIADTDLLLDAGDRISLNAGTLFELYVNDTNCLMVEGMSGNVGIGTSIPGAKLDVDGTAAMTGFRMPTGASAGDVLTADASGSGTWQAPSTVTVPGSDTQMLYNDEGEFGAAEVYYDEATGRLGIGVPSPTHTLDIGSSADLLCGIVEADLLVATSMIATNGSSDLEVLHPYVNLDGSLGVGTDAVPGTALKVSGTTETGSIRVTASPADSYVLTSDSSGNGTWQAVPIELTTDSVGVDEIATDAVRADEIMANSVGQSELAPNAVSAAEIQTGAVDSDEIATDAVDSDEIATDAVGPDEIATDAVGAAEIAPNAVGFTDLAETFKKRYVNINTLNSNEYIWHPNDWSKTTPVVYTIGTPGQIRIQDTAGSGTVRILVMMNGSVLTSTTAPYTLNMTGTNDMYDIYVYPDTYTETWFVHFEGTILSSDRIVGLVEGGAN